MTGFRLELTANVVEILERMAANPTHATKLKKVRNTLAKLQAQGPRYPGLQSHEYNQLFGPNGEKVWESYVENRTPGAWRVWWFYGPGRNVITVINIAEHPD